MSKPPFLGLPPTVRARRLPTARGEFAVLEAGEPAAGTALLLPGFTGSKEDFLALLAPLAGMGYRTVAVDGRGQYETGGPREESAYAQPELARDVLALAAALREGGDGRDGTDGDASGEPPVDPVDRVHLLGHSLGGLVARAAVLLDASPFASLTLMSSGPAAVSTVQQRRLKMLLGALGVMEMAEIWRAMCELDPAEAADEDTPPHVAEFLRRRWIRHVPEQLAATGKQLLDEPDRIDALATVLRDRAEPLPVHVISGSVDYAWPVRLLDETAVRLGAARTVVADAGHSPNAERPEETARALASFWSGDLPGK
ncbi:alpha/beta fold hydrolase [Streptomyces sp. HNM0575]|uniref:alpha/beta fold hydrolase n=1 Tax=Streptomyces sp. HNM0575 TaxID=2716338 RepID=UPI00145E371E|nr:alpha/beta fold hydrolase [Streptomyces sp. HNM0575]NLU72079.1 alpha/beta fold hydrolase [Streptomyces sp. HNM0575]